ncbi:hypothetical protein CU633_04600 [Bacillus sp. V3-13]|nr:hypothetical protein CU633_04600 [Bacillus sp. V3-13]
MNIKKSLYLFLIFSFYLSACTNENKTSIEHQDLQKSPHGELSSSVNENSICYRTSQEGKRAGQLELNRLSQ